MSGERRYSYCVNPTLSEANKFMTNVAQHVPCLVCGTSLELRLAKGRKSGKPFIMLICPKDGRHFRGFINDQTYVKEVLARLEGHTPAQHSGGDVDADSDTQRPSKTDLERGRG